MLQKAVTNTTEKARLRSEAVRVRSNPPHAVIIIENMTVPPDRRVWQQAKALRDDGWRVSVITPKVGSYKIPRETIDGIEIFRHDLLLEARNITSYLLEYSSALIGEISLLLRMNLREVDVVQICNPPDFLFAPALIAKALGPAKVVFDHHDLTPELLVEKTGKNSSLLLQFARWAERRTFGVADRVISTNPSFKKRAISSGKDENHVEVVYSTPDFNAFAAGHYNENLKCGKKHLLFWVGVLGSQDGVDLLMDAVWALSKLPGGDDFHLLIAGDGPERAVLERYARDIGVAHLVTFAGFLSGSDLADAFVTADIGIGSDPKNDFNDRLAMNKVFEYMAYELPIVMFDLDECRRLAGDAAFYASLNDPNALAAKISNLLEAPAMRAAMGQRGHERLISEFSWDQQKERYLNVYRSLL